MPSPGLFQVRHKPRIVMKNSSRTLLFCAIFLGCDNAQAPKPTGTPPQSTQAMPTAPIPMPPVAQEAPKQEPQTKKQLEDKQDLDALTAFVKIKAQNPEGLQILELSERAEWKSKWPGDYCRTFVIRCQQIDFMPPLSRDSGMVIYKKDGSVRTVHLNDSRCWW